MKGRRTEWDNKIRENVTTEFRFEVPEGCHTLFDASQSTIVIKNPHGHTLLALKQIHQFWIEEIDISWGPAKEWEDKMTALQDKLGAVESELAFYKEVQSAKIEEADEAEQV